MVCTRRLCDTTSIITDRNIRRRLTILGMITITNRKNQLDTLHTNEHHKEKKKLKTNVFKL